MSDGYAWRCPDWMSDGYAWRCPDCPYGQTAKDLNEALDQIDEHSKKYHPREAV